MLALLLLTATICDVVWQFRSNDNVLPVSLADDNQDSETIARLPAAVSEQTPLLTTNVQAQRSECSDEVKQATCGKSVFALA